MTTLLILGGTVFLGPAVVEAARARGHAVTLFHRGRNAHGLFPDVETLLGDRTQDLAPLAGRHWDAVIDTCGYLPRVVERSARLLAPAVGLYVFVSSLSVYARNDLPGQDETAPLAVLEDPGSEDVAAHYGALKARCERAVETACAGRAALVRPGLIVGPRDPSDRFTYWPVRARLGGDALAPGDGSDPVQVVDVRDLAAFLLDVVEHRHTGPCNAIGPAQPLPMAEFLDACRQGAGADVCWRWVPAAFLEQEGISPWSDLPVWMPATPELRGFHTTSVQRAVERGLRFRPLVETVRDTLAWWHTLPEARRTRLRAGLPREREAALLARWQVGAPPAGGRGVERREPLA
ncbi:MAG: epimerase [Planctomycetes bacterium]|nr:epimerase [Planctomycetota bacterium]